VEEFRKLANICQRYGQLRSGTFFETQCSNYSASTQYAIMKCDQSVVGSELFSFSCACFLN